MQVSKLESYLRLAAIIVAVVASHFSLKERMSVLETKLDGLKERYNNAVVIDYRDSVELRKNNELARNRVDCP